MDRQCSGSQEYNSVSSRGTSTGRIQNPDGGAVFVSRAAGEQGLRHWVTILKSFRLRNASDIRDPRRLRSRLSSRGETNQCARESVICRSSCYTPRTIEINLRPATNKTPLSSLRRTRETNSNDNPCVNLIYYSSLARNLRILGMLLYGYEIFGMKRRFRTLPVIRTAHLWLFFTAVYDFLLVIRNDP